MEIKKVYKQALPKMRFVGKKYTDADRVDGTFGAKWDEWFKNDWFEPLGYRSDIFEDSNAYIGLMRWKEGEAFEYWIGVFEAPDFVVPTGYESIDFDPSSIGVCWLYGYMNDLFMHEETCAKRLREEGYELVDIDGAWWFFERYASPRFTEADEQDKRILDICHFIK